jgi:SHS2 domain-containing protein
VAYRLLDHTADLLLEATGDTAGEALAEAGLGLAQVVSGRAPHRLKPDTEIAFRLEVPERPMAAVAFLAELLWVLESKGEMWIGGGVEVTEGPMTILVAKGNGVKYDPAKHGRGVEVKAVTYHDLEFGPHGKAWRLRVILDI